MQRQSYPLIKVLQWLVFVGSCHALQILMIPHCLKVSANQETVNLVAILPFKLLNVFVDVVELSMAAALDSDLDGLQLEEWRTKKFKSLLSWVEPDCNPQKVQELEKAASKYGGNCRRSVTILPHLTPPPHELSRPLRLFTTLHGLRHHLGLSNSYAATSFPSSIHNAYMNLNDGLLPSFLSPQSSSWHWIVQWMWSLV